jgi:hypothetical protein
MSGAITTNVASSSGAGGIAGPSESLPGSSPGSTVVQQRAFPRVPTAAGCLSNKLILTGVFPQAGKTQLLGVAPAASVGKRVSILSSWNGKPVASPTVQPDLTFKATVPFPPRSLRFTNRATYIAKLQRHRQAPSGTTG